MKTENARTSAPVDRLVGRIPCLRCRRKLAKPLCACEQQRFCSVKCAAYWAVENTTDRFWCPECGWSDRFCACDEHRGEDEVDVEC